MGDRHHIADMGNDKFFYVLNPIRFALPSGHAGGRTHRCSQTKRPRPRIPAATIMVVEVQRLRCLDVNDDLAY